MNMKTVTIGDIHGMNNWKDVDPNEYDKIIFVGDYVDSFTVSNEYIIKNLNDIIDFKKSYSDKVVLLYGNHDIQYLYNESYKYKCSGYRPEYSLQLKEIFNSNKDLFLFSYQIDNVIWTHAGISKFWANNILEDINILEYANKINEIGQNRFTLNEIMIVGRSRGGFALSGGPLWADFNSDMKDDAISGLIQIFGHTVIDNITTIEGYNTELVNVDTLQTSGEIYEREFDF